MSKTAVLTYPPGSEWLMQHFTSMQDTQLNNARGALGEFTKSVSPGSDSGGFGKMAYEVCGIVYEQAFRLAMTVKDFLWRNGVKVSMKIKEIIDGDPVNSFTLKVGDNEIKFKERPDDYDMIERDTSSKI